ncbi:ABC transporter ATP-binding protein [Anaerotalea alkaliphila]|uniref:ABC transporter ATP-binding protein n=1 Tax=Anaerotalea alkaliphila TaxID=2662126 RepID=A0A7X5HWQ6_9FIRM|nr:ABC transporter ATP-binding protein [Anaerotalea alkaliphila]NDL67988.1 ABC transporter ATP-binding protein [Anaerotalea alkaliphila]
MNGFGGGMQRGIGSGGTPVAKAKDMRETLLRLWTYFGNERKGLLAVFALSLGGTLLGLASPYLIGRVIDGLEMERIPGMESRERLFLLCMGLGAVYAADALAGLGQGWLMARISQNVVHQLRKNLFGKLQKLPLRFFDTHTHGEVMSRLANDVDNISSTVATSMTQFFSGVLMVGGALGVMLWLSPLLTMASAVTLPLMLLLTRTIGRKTRELFREQQNALGRLNGLIEEGISGLLVVKAYNREAVMGLDFQKANQALMQAGIRAQVWAGMMMPSMHVLNNLGFVTVAFFGGWMALHSMASIGLIASFVGYTKQFTRPLVTLSNIYNTLQTAIAGAERVFEVLDEEEEAENVEKPLPLGRIQGRVVFDRVDFSYEPGQPVLKSISFQVRPGMTVALVGPTGAGKTTIVNLLTRFYEADGGSITIDGNPIGAYAREELLGRFGVVLQDTYLFAGTIRENLRYGRQDAGDKEILEAARVSGAHQFIHHLPHGYDTELVESGRNLSQGERQLLAITRAMLTEHDILVLDEATSNIDTRTEMHIQSALLKLMEGKTSFVIAHRLSTIRDADLILVVEEGRISQQGTHQTLSMEEGYYRNSL